MILWSSLTIAVVDTTVNNTSNDECYYRLVTVRNIPMRHSFYLITWPPPHNMPRSCWMHTSVMHEDNSTADSSVLNLGVDGIINTGSLLHAGLANGE